MKTKLATTVLFSFFLFSVPSAAQFAESVPADAQFVPIGGNTWQFPTETRRNSFLTNEGIKGWDNAAYSFNTYVRFADQGRLSVWLSVDDAPDAATLSVTIKGEVKEVHVPVNLSGDIFIGEWAMTDTGYVVVALNGLKEDAALFPQISGYKISGTAVSANTVYVKNNEGNFFYWGRRGPSVHLGYQVPADKDIKWYYNEITVPEGDDVIGSYYMANGFSGGYFGIQANSEEERRVLFSVWSPYHTDDPNEIPEDQRIKLLKKGADVYTGEFGNEGSGGQSYLRYNWKAGNTYRFLLSGEPVGNDHTVYTAWFFAPEEDEWRLIASFSRTHTNSWLKGFHSFLENFSPQQGIYERKVYFSNQWSADKEGNWYEATQAKFTADNTARTGYRLDYAGGSEAGRFFLRNCGFFADYTVVDTFYERPATNQKPTVDLTKLP